MNYTSNTEYVFSSNYVADKVFAFFRNSNGTISYRFGKADITTKNIDVSNKIIDVDVNLLTELLRIENENFSITTNGASGKGTNPIYIGKSSSNGKSPQIKIFSFSIYEESDLLLLQFIPCINSDNKVGMYDTVSGTFFEARYGSYTPGPTI